jgi:hypothetical protein
VQVGGDPPANYAYDPVGNRLSWNTTSYGYDRADRIMSAGATSYAVNFVGNLTARGSDSFVYDQANRLTSATVGGTTSTYVYLCKCQAGGATKIGSCGVIQLMSADLRRVVA